MKTQDSEVIVEAIENASLAIVDALTAMTEVLKEISQGISEIE